MINRMALCVWGAGLAMPSLSWLIDEVLDHIDQFRDLLVPAHAQPLSRAEAPAEAGLMSESLPAQ